MIERIINITCTAVLSLVLVAVGGGLALLTFFSFDAGYPVAGAAGLSLIGLWAFGSFIYGAAVVQDVRRYW